MNDIIKQLINKVDLTEEKAEEIMDVIMRGELSDTQISSYLTALKMKGETIEEITGSARALRRHVKRILHDRDVLEVVGTGGDMSHSFNISTTTAIVVSSLGIPVAKHGNRSVSSSCGAADVLEELGVNIMLSSKESKQLLDEIGICFLYAPTYHTAMRYVAPVRKELGIPTIFNILGPLVNPAGANHQLLGVYREDLVAPLATVLRNLGVKRGFVVHGKDGLDEISLTTSTLCYEIRDGNIEKMELLPEDFGLTPCKASDLVGGNKEVNAKITLDILHGVKGPKRDAVVMNAAACVYLVKDDITLKDAVKMVEETIDNKHALKQLERFIFRSKEVGKQ